MITVQQPIHDPSDRGNAQAKAGEKGQGARNRKGKPGNEDARVKNEQAISGQQPTVRS